MKRPRLVWLSVIVHALFAVTCLIGLWVILHEALTPDVVAEGSDAVHGLYLGAWGAGGCALLYGLVATELWFRRKWAWCLAIVVNGAFGGAILLDPLTERNWDWEDSWLGIVFAVIVVLLVLPSVRKFFFKRESAVVQNPTVAEGTT